MADETPNNPETNADADAAAWEAALAAEGGGAGGAAPATDEAGKILNQNEIDSLLGFDSAGDDSNANTGIKAILDKSRMAYEKLPMIEVVFDRLVKQLSSSLRNFTSDNVDVNIDSMVSQRFDDYLNTIPLPALLIVFRAVEWENFGIVTVDSSLIYSMVDVLLGGRRSPKAARIDGRPYTTIEQDIIKRMVDIVLADMSAAFEPLSPATFQFERLEANPRFATITRPSNPTLLVKLRVDMEDRGGLVEICIPHNTLEPIRDLLLQMFMGEKFGQDTMWEKHLSRELRVAEMDIEAVLNEKTVLLGEVMQFKVSSTILLDCSPEDEIIIKSGGVPMTTGKVGRMGEQVAVALSEPVRRIRDDMIL